MAPYFTVIVPIYRCEPYIEQCLRSLTDQTFGDFEAICVDDASPDASLTKAKTAVDGDDRFKFVQRPKNGGLSAARNSALERAVGEVVVFLDSDDYLVPQALEHIQTRFESQALDDLYFNAESFYEDSEAYSLVVEDFSKRDDFSDVATGRELFTILEERNQFFPHAALRAVRRGLLEREEIRFREGIIHEDVLFTLQTLLASKRSSFLNEPLYRRRIHTGSIMAAPRRTMANIIGHLVAIRFMRAWMFQHAPELDERFIAAMAHRMDSYLKVCAEDYARDIEPDERAAYLGGLSPAERVEFEWEVAQPAALLTDIYESTTWRIGSAAIAVPLAARESLKKLRRAR